MLKPLTFLMSTTAICLFSQSNTVRYAATFKPSPVQMPYGAVQASAASEEGSFFLVASSPMNPKFSIVQVSGENIGRTKEVSIASGSLTAFSGRYFVWNQATPLNSILHIYRNSDGREASIPTTVKDVFHLHVIGEYVVLAHKTNGRTTISQLNLSSEKLSLVEQLNEDVPVLRFGESSGFSTLLIDPVSARFKQYTIGEKISAGSWVRIDSPLIQNLRDKKRPIALGQVGPVYYSIVIGHATGMDGSHYFFTTQNEKGVGRYGVKCDAQGKEIGKFLLEFPEGDYKKMSFLPFSTFESSKSYLQITNLDGTVLRYEGVTL